MERAAVSGRWPRVAVVVLLVGAAVATAGVLAVRPNPVLAVAPAGVLLVLYVTATVPLRWSAIGLILLVLSLEISTDAAGVWHTPLAKLGDALQGRPGWPVNGLELIAVYLLVIAALRANRRSAIDPPGWIPAASAVRDFLVLFVAGVLYAELNGLVRGGSVAPWKVRQLADIPLLFLMFDRALRGPRDIEAIGRVVVAAACAKALLALAVQWIVAPSLTGGQLAHATNHGDSVLFSLAAFILVANFTERRDASSLRWALALLPLLVLGMVANNRRSAWVMLAIALAIQFLLTPPRPWKRALTRIAILSVPLVALYVAVGWDRSGPLFVPVHLLRVLTDSSLDSSTLWRDVENWNIANSMRWHPIAGLGLGKEYFEPTKGADISSLFADYRAWPHNSVLGLLLFAGPIAFTAIWALFALTVFLAVRAYHRASVPADRAAALSCVAAVAVCAVLAYGDTGAHHVQYRLVSALALAVAGKLAVSTGAWPASRRRRSMARIPARSALLHHDGRAAATRAR